MKKWGVTVAIIIGLVVVWNIAYPSGTWRYKLTLVVDDNGKQVTGSSVVQVQAAQGIKLTPESTTPIWIKGEAVAVDLGEKGVLFSLLRKDSNVDYGYYIVFDMFPIPNGPGGETTSEGIRYYSHLEGKRSVPFDKLPMLVRFRDINDPKTVEKVDPNDLAKSFGPGVKLVSATIEMTDDGVTRGIEKRLGWLPGRKNVIGYLGGWPEDPSKLYLNGSEFSKGIFQ